MKVNYNIFIFSAKNGSIPVMKSSDIKSNVTNELPNPENLAVSSM